MVDKSMSEKDSYQKHGSLRVLHIITRIANGGSERRLLDALEVPAQHSVMTGELQPSRNLNDVTIRVPVVLAKSLRRKPSPWYDAVTVANIRSRILSESIDVVHSHQSKAGMLSRIALATLAPGRRPKLIHSLSMASFGPGYGRISSSIFRLLEQTTHRWVDEYLVVGSDLVRSYQAIGVPKEKLRCVRSSLELESFGEASKKREFSSEPVKLLFVGSLDERKGVHLLPDIVRLVESKIPVTLTVAGVGPLSTQLQQLTDKIKLPITLVGYHKDVARLMEGSDLLILPSSAEGLPQVLVQAATNELPFVTFNVHGAQELINFGIDGKITKETTSESMAHAIMARITGERPKMTTALPLSQWKLERIREQISQAYTIAVVGHNECGLLKKYL